MIHAPNPPRVDQSHDRNSKPYLRPHYLASVELSFQRAPFRYWPAFSRTRHTGLATIHPGGSAANADRADNFPSGVASASRLHQNGSGMDNIAYVRQQRRLREPW